VCLCVCVCMSWNIKEITIAIILTEEEVFY